jgi:hypothetical protein
MGGKKGERKGQKKILRKEDLAFEIIPILRRRMMRALLLAFIRTPPLSTSSSSPFAVTRSYRNSVIRSSTRLPSVRMCHTFFLQPVAIVPCCVYSKLFPKRQGVRTTAQLIDYLQRKDTSIRRTALSFEVLSLSSSSLESMMKI